jgi:hypothetical protein
MTRTCANCEFWQYTDTVADKPQGECRRSAPAADGWCGTLSTDWCGEHQPKAGKVRPLSYRNLGVDC